MPDTQTTAAPVDGTGDMPRVPRRVLRGADRREARQKHALERRSGFDRRRHYPVTGALRDNPTALLVVLILTNALSALDFLLTYAQLQAGTIEEGNPVLASLFEQGVGQAWVFKTGLMLAVSIVIWHRRNHRAVLAVAVGALVTYLLVVAYHLIGMALT